MKSSKDYQRNNYALLLLGEPKSGKSTVAMGFPSPYFLLCSDDLIYASQRYPNKEFYFDRVEVDDDGNDVPDQQRWVRSQKCLEAASKDPRIKTIVVDTLNRYSEYLCSMLINDPRQATNALVIGGQKCMTQNHWYPFGTLMRQFVSDLRSTGKLVICTCHRKVDKDDMTGTLFYKPALGGQSADNLGGLFTDIWCCEATSCPPDQQHPRGVKYTVRTVPGGRMSLGSAFPIPSEFEFSWDILAEHLSTDKVATIDK